MKLILFLLLITTTAHGQTSETYSPSLEDGLGMHEAQELNRLRKLSYAQQKTIDSLQSKINKQLEYHYYSCEIISSLRPNGTLANRRQYHKAIRAFFERYGMVKMKVKASKF